MGSAGGGSPMCNVYKGFGGLSGVGIRIGNALAIGAACISLVLRAIPANAAELVGYNMPTTSMIPTLLVGDHFYVLKTPGQPMEPHRGDVVLLTIPSTGVAWIKRVIGLPGDTVRLRSGRLHINGALVNRELLGDYPGKYTTLTHYREHLPGGSVHEIVEESDSGPRDDTELFIVPANHVFVLGDNRDNSQDSRLSSFGFIPIENLIGRVTIVYWSDHLDRIGRMVE